MYTLLLFATTWLASAGSLAGVTLPDSTTVGGQTLTLNGMGLREKLGFLDIYVAGLYLPAKSSDGSKVISSDVPKQIVMHFVYNVTRDQLVETFRESISKNPKAASFSSQMQQLEAGMTDMKKGDQIKIEYIPGTGTNIYLRGTKKATLSGKDFMEALFSIYLGPNPPTAALKSGLLGQ
jgi:hypothetical protein